MPREKTRPGVSTAQHRVVWEGGYCGNNAQQTTVNHATLRKSITMNVTASLIRFLTDKPA